MVVFRAGDWRQTALLLIVPLFAASCGGAATPTTPTTQDLTGPGFTFSAPLGWTVKRTATSVVARSAAEGALVSATRFTLLKAYDPSRFAATAKELDSVAAKLARDANGAITASETATVDGRKVRSYRFTSRSGGRDLDDRLAFVLSGLREVQLLCQAPRGKLDAGGACSLLFDSFALTA